MAWGNLEYDLTPELSVRAGRVVLPTFMAAEYRKVGYANPWVRPPAEVYRLVPVSNVYLGRLNRFPNGDAAVPIDQREGSPTTSSTAATSDSPRPR